MSLNQEDLEALSKSKTVLTGEVLDDDTEYEMDIEEELLAELKASRDLLRKCLIMFYYLGDNVQRITKREITHMSKMSERIETRLEEADEVINKCEDE